MKSKAGIIISVLLVVAISFFIYQNFLVDNEVEHLHDSAEELYTCGMHPDILSEEPGNCPICEMKLTPVSDNRQSKGDIVNIDAVVQQNMNLKTVVIETKDISPRIVANAVIIADHRFDFNLTSKINGWVEKLYISFEGEEIEEGQKLCDIYSPDLVTAQHDLINALNYYETLASKNDESLLKSGEDLVKGSEKKLELLSMSQKDIEALKESREVKTTISISSPTDGVVTIINIVQEQKISDGDMLVQVSDPGKLWVIADVYENELALIDVGNETVTTVDVYPSLQFEGMVNFIFPTIYEATRIAKVRIDIENDYMKLKPFMKAKVEIEGEEIDDALVIPEDAVIISSSKNIAVHAIGDGKFQLLEIKLGVYTEGYYQVLSGLNEGDRVVSSVQLLLDSESGLKSAIEQFTASTYPDSGVGHIMPSQESDSELVRRGIIDVESLDENDDRHLYECPMDWNVLSDVEGICPVCNMDLEKYSLEEVKKNLDDTGHQYKKD